MSTADSQEHKLSISGERIGNDCLALIKKSSVQSYMLNLVKPVLDVLLTLGFIHLSGLIEFPTSEDASIVM